MKHTTSKTSLYEKSNMECGKVEFQDREVGEIKYSDFIHPVW